MDAISLLKADHDKVKGLLTELESTTERAIKTRTELFARIKEELTVHEVIEEEIFYPELKAHPKAEDIVLEGFEEHHVVDLLLGELSETPVEDESWGAKAKVMKENPALLEGMRQPVVDLFAVKDHANAGALAERYVKTEGNDVEIRRIQLMNKDSLDMSPDDHDLIAQTAESLARANDGVVITHGTDRLAVTGERIVERCPAPAAPIVLTGAIRPYVLRTTDAVQNLTEALLAAQLAPPGVYVAMHNQVLRFPGVIKDADLRTFVKRA